MRVSQLEIVTGFPAVGVAVLGDVMLDRLVQGSVHRISPEAPIPVLQVSRQSASLGGAGNVAANLAALGGHVHLIGVAGADAAGDELLAVLAQEKNIAAAVTQNAALATIVKTRFVAQGQQLLRVDAETAATVPQPLQESLLASLRQALPRCAALILSDYAKGVLSQSLTAAAIAMARDARIPVIVDPKGRDFSRYAGADLITPNAQEAALATGLPCESDEDAAAAARAILAVVKGRAVLITRGDKGMTLLSRWDGNETLLHIAATAREVADVTGAGDTCVAVLALALAAGASSQDAAVLANQAAGVAVGKLGTAPVRAAELTRAIELSGFLTAHSKVAPPERAMALAQAWRSRGEKLVFTNGCFDLLHPGHVRLLEQARAQGDRLIVAINDDASVARLKGPSRPIQKEAARAAVLASIGVVDLVTVFADDTPRDLIAALKPDVLVKGADYSEAEVVGADLVRSHGGRVVLVPLEAGHSTSDAIRRAGRSG